MSTYSYFATDLVTGALRADSIPLHVSSFSRNLGGIGQPGQLQATLDLGALPSQSNLLEALEPRRTLLWARQDGYPVWAGVLWDWAHVSAKSNELPIVANEVSSLFQRRQIREDQVFPPSPPFDLLDIIRVLFQYGTSKTGGGIAQLVYSSNVDGRTTSTTFPAANLTSVLDAVTQFCTQWGLEYAFEPNLAPGNTPRILLRLGNSTTMGRPYSSTNLQLIYPGNLVDYAWPRTGSQSSNSVRAVATGAGGLPWQSSESTHGLDAADLAAGYPRLESSVSYTGSVITAQSQIDAFADSRQALVDGSPVVPKATIVGGQTPTVQQIQLGDHAMLLATSSLHPAPTSAPLTPGLMQDVRIVGWTVRPPNEQQPETTDLFLAGVSS